MDKDICKCGNSSAEYRMIGEDEWELILTNGTIKKDGYGKYCECLDCKEQFSLFDPCMVKLVTFNKL
jgi:hypothetical protein